MFRRDNVRTHYRLPLTLTRTTEIVSLILITTTVRLLVLSHYFRRTLTESLERALSTLNSFEQFHTILSQRKNKRK